MCRKMKKYNIIIVVSLCFLFSCNNYTEFKPVISNSENFYSTDSLKKTDYINILQVFDYYSIDYKIVNSKILINKKEYTDKELMYNFTVKMRDTLWLSTHKK